MAPNGNWPYTPCPPPPAPAESTVHERLSYIKNRAVAARRPDIAEKAMEVMRSHPADPNDAAGHVHQAYLHAKAKKWEDCKRELEEAID